MAALTVGELKTFLELYPENMRVFVDGFEGGYDDPTFHEIEVVLNANENISYFGKHFEEDSSLLDSTKNHVITKGLCLSRYEPLTKE